MSETPAISFFSYEDFLGEVMANGVTLVRLQDYYRSKPTQIGVNWVDHYVEVSARANGEMFVCRFRTGGSLECEKLQMERAAQNTQQAVDILRRDLERRGLQVRPGIFDNGEVNAIASGPWYFERDESGLPVLVQEEQQ